MKRIFNKSKFSPILPDGRLFVFDTFVEVDNYIYEAWLKHKSFSTSINRGDFVVVDVQKMKPPSKKDTKHD